MKRGNAHDLFMKIVKRMIIFRMTTYSMNLNPYEIFIIG